MIMIKLKQKYFFIQLMVLVASICVIQVSAQNTTVIKGKVISKKTGKPLEGITVVEKDRNDRIVNGVPTDINGNYQIKVSDVNDSLYFSHIGLKTETRAINNKITINVSLTEDSKTLDAVVVTSRRAGVESTGGFLGVDKHLQSAAITTVKMKDLEEVPATSIDQVLQGQVAGLMINMNSGDPGSGSSIQIRGASSIGLGSKPLIVVDDVPFKTQQRVDVNSPEGLSDLVNISPSDIETISILKDAAATALYGSDGSNGVIVIKTKRGEKGAPRVNISSMSSVNLPQRPIPLLNGDQYKTMILEAYQHRYGTNVDLNTSPIRNLFLDPSDLNYENYNNNTYWPDKINMRQGYGETLSGSVIGGGDAARYNVSLGYTNSAGPALGTKFERVSGRFNFDYKISNKLSFMSDISYSDSKKKSTYANTGDISLRKAPILPVYNQDQYGNSLSTYFFPGNTGFQNDVNNPIALANNALANDGENRLDGTISVRYNPVKGLQINNLISTTYDALTSDRFLPHSATGADYYRANNFYLTMNSSVNSSSVYPVNAYSMYVKNDIIYQKDIGKNKLMGGLYTIYQTNTSYYMNLVGTNSPSEFLTSPYSTDIQTTTTSGRTLNRDLSVVGQAYYFYEDRYSISGSVRRQGNSAFGRNNRYGNFPAVSGFWRPSSEPFLKGKFTWLDDLKFRGSWGITGRAPTVSAANAFTFSANSPFIDIAGVTPDNIQLVNLRWEKTTTTNLGVDLSLWNGRLSLTSDISQNTTRDLLLNAPLSNTSGFETVTQNFGTLKGKTAELSVTGQPLATKNWKLTASFDISTSSNRVMALPNNAPVIRGNVLDNGLYLSLINVGDRFGTIYGLKSLGVYSRDEDAYVKNSKGEYITDVNGNKVPVRWLTQNGEPFVGGDAHYADLNNDGVINRQDVTAIGNATPKYYGGFMFRLNYRKAWEMFSTFTYQTDFDIINMAKMVTSNMYTNNNQSQAVMRRWRKPGDITDVPRALYGAGHNWVGSDRFVEDGSYIKFNTLSLAYNFQRSLLERIKIRSAKLAFTVSNLYILTKYSGVDPSISLNSNDPFSFGQDNALTPIPIAYTAAIWVNF
jgi:TonB-linked SusC/RagA family outer membrane protein